MNFTCTSSALRPRFSCLLYSVLAVKFLAFIYRHDIDSIAKQYHRRFEGPKRPFREYEQKRYIDAWREIQSNTQATSEPTVEDALNLSMSFHTGDGMHVLIIGSLYLVGSALHIPEQGEWSYRGYITCNIV